MMNVQQIKSDFPIFKKHPDLTYLDSAGTSLKPQVVIDKLVEYYSQYSANIKRGIYKLSEKATEEFEKTREVVANFIGARKKEVIFTHSTTESLNLVAYSLGRKIIEKNDEIVVSIMEHHSNFVPWQVLAGEVGANFKVIGVEDNGYLLGLDNVEEIITKRTKILALTYVSNVLGTINPLKKIIQAAKKINPKLIVVIDAAQAAPHMKIDVKDLDCDFLAFSSHKMLGPTGVGVLWGKEHLLNEMFPFQYGGEMIAEVRIDKTIFAQPPEKFEAGTPAIAEVIAFKEAIKYLQKIGLENIRKHEKELMDYALHSLTNTFGKKIKIYGPPGIENRGGVIAFSLSGTHPHDLATILDENDICVRAGHHCAMPLHTRLDIPASTRASLYLYNDKGDIDKLVKVLKESLAILSKS